MVFLRKESGCCMVPSLDLMEFIEQEILPRYTQFDAAHNLSHVKNVINTSLALARENGADVNMAYAVAAYHDLGLEGPRAIHHITSGKILQADRRLRKWFSEHQIAMMRQAVEDHRASASHEPRNLYGKIVAEADRDLTPDHVILRTIQFGMAHYPELDQEKHWERLVQHLQEKFGINGYIKLWMPRSQNEKNLQELRQLIANPTLLRERFNQFFTQEKQTQK